MKDISFFSRIYLAINSVDFRKQAHGLALLVEHTLKLTPTKEKCLFVFTNRRKNAIKLLYFDDTGYAMWWKVLERDKFRWPKDDSEAMLIQPRELRWLLDGIDFFNLKKHKKLVIN